MKKFILFLFLCAISIKITSQYRTIIFDRAEETQLKLVQIDFMERSTLFHFQYSNVNGVDNICANENIYIYDTHSSKSYKLLNSINLPFCEKVHIFDKPDQNLNFTLEFQKIPKEITEFNIIDEKNGEFNFSRVKIDTVEKAINPLNLEDFYNETPVNEYGFYYKDGNKVYYHKYNGLVIAAALSTDNTFGKYNQIYLLIQNFTGREFNIVPDDLSAQYFYFSKNQRKFSKEFDDVYYDSQQDSKYTKNIIRINDTLFQQNVPILTFNEYLKNVRKAQAWETFAMAFSQSLAAAAAGYSSININSSIYEYGNAYGSAHGNIGNSFINVYGSSSSNSKSFGSTSIKAYNAGATYNAMQNAQKNINDYQNQQFQILNTLSEGYLKLNTIMNQTEYVGFINLPFNDANIIELNIPIKGVVYKFIWKK